LDKNNLFEIISRFICHKNLYKSSDNTVKIAAFMPHPQYKCLSVFGVSGLCENEIFELGSRVKSDKLYGFANIDAVSINNIGLDIDADNNPYRHANIIGWPEEYSEIQLKAAHMALKAKLFLKIK